MIALILNLPSRQKSLFILTLSIGLLIWFCSVKNIFSLNAMNSFIFFYSFGIPFLLLSFSTIMDLNENKVFLIWLAFSIILLLISVSTKNSSQFQIHRSAQFDKSSGFNSLMSDHSTASLKSLFFFLIVYWPLNQISKKVTGNFIVNTYGQKTWTNEEAKRKMTGMDVLCNLILFVIIFCSVLF
ncbi:MAG: hypothetical protein ACJ748_10555 [Flavisolibacter sp.]